MVLSQTVKIGRPVYLQYSFNRNATVADYWRVDGDSYCWNIQFRCLLDDWEINYMIRVPDFLNHVQLCFDREDCRR